MNTEIIRNAANPKLEMTVHCGHFATRHSHNTHYLDLTRMKHESTMAREAAITMAHLYASSEKIDTIVCLDGSEVIGSFLARHLSTDDRFSVNKDKTINIITPEFDSTGLLIFRENLSPMIYGKDVLILADTVNSGKTVRSAVECVKYYGGNPKSIAAVFSKMGSVANTPVYSLFTPLDIKGYACYPSKDCPLCQAGQKIDGLANCYGISRF